MKILNKGIATVVSVLLTSAAQIASAAPTAYHTDHGNYFYTGTVTIQSSGKACAFKKQVYKNAEMGSVYTSTNAYVGYGFVSEYGELLALSNDDVTSMTSISTHAHGSSHGGYLSNMKYTFFMDINNTTFTNRILGSYTSDSCSIEKFFPSPSSQISYDIDYYSFKPAKISMRYGFFGISSPKQITLKNGSYEHQKLTFSGAMTFSGEGTSGNPGFFP